jgi:hypothetical protein
MPTPNGKPMQTHVTSNKGHCHSERSRGIFFSAIAEGDSIILLSQGDPAPDQA